MPFPDNKALRGFRSQAQSRWAHATNQWWADEYDKYTDYSLLPDKVQEDITEEIDEYGIIMDDEHPLVEKINKIEKMFSEAKMVDSFDEASKELFSFIKDYKRINKDEKMSEEISNKISGFIEIAKVWNEEGKIKNASSTKWDDIINQFEIETNKETDTIMNLNENALIRKIVRENNIDQNTAEAFWSQSVTEQNNIYGTDSSNGRKYWNSVIESFNKKIRNLDLLEAKRIMEHKRNLKSSIEEFINNIARKDYTSAQGSIPQMVREKMGTMINSKKEAYLKELGSQVQERAKEV